MFQRYLPAARAAVTAAQQHARDLGAIAAGTEHLLLGLLDDPMDLAAALLVEAGVRPERLVEALPAGHASQGYLPWTPRATAVLTHEAPHYADELGSPEVATVHVLIALVSDRTARACKALQTIAVDVAELDAACRRAAQDARRHGTAVTSLAPTVDHVSDAVLAALFEARRAARRQGAALVSPGHLLQGLAAVPVSVAGDLLAHVADRVHEVTDLVPPPAGSPDSLAMTISARTLMHQAAVAANLVPAGAIGTVHVLHALLRHPPTAVAVRGAGLDVDALLAEALRRRTETDPV